MGLRVKMKIDSRKVSKLHSALTEIGTKAALVADRNGINEITKVVSKDAKSRTKRRSGQLRKSIGRIVKTYRQLVTVGVVGPRRGFKVSIGGVPVDPAKYAHLVEGGRGPVRAGAKSSIPRAGVRVVSKTGKTVLSSYRTAVAPDVVRVFGPVVGPAAPRPFLQPAWDANKARATEIMVQSYRNELSKVGRSANWSRHIRAADGEE